MKGLGSIILVVLATSQVHAKDYHIFTDKQLNWAEAVADCLDRGMRLATVMSEAQQDNLRQTIEAAGLTNQALWLSGADLGTSRTFVWMSTGKPVEYTNWRPGQPDTMHENCLGIWPQNGLSVWNDFVCTNKMAYVCETKPPCCAQPAK